MASSFVTTSVQSSAALSVLATGASVTYYARLWYTLPYAILTVPITTAMFTELSDSWAKEDRASFCRGITNGVNQILFFMVPFMIYLAVFSTPLISVLAAGKFDSESLAMTASYLAVYSVTLPAYAICMYLQKVASAMRRMGLYAFASVVASVVQVIILLAFTTSVGLNFVAFSSTVFFVIIDLVMFVSLRKNLGPLGISSMVTALFKSLLLGAAGGAAGAAILWALNSFVGDCTGATLRSILYCVLAGIPSVVVTYGLAALLKMPEAKLIKVIVNRFIRR